MATVHAATISHKHGVNLYLGLTPESLNSQLAGFCRQYWDDVTNADPDLPKNAPESDEETVFLYFDTLLNFGGDEYLEHFGPVEAR